MQDERHRYILWCAASTHFELGNDTETRKEVEIDYIEKEIRE